MSGPPRLLRRHRWGEAVRFERNGVVKVTRHEGDSHWIEFFRGLERIAKAGEPTPPCEARP